VDDEDSKEADDERENTRTNPKCQYYFAYEEIKPMLNCEHQRRRETSLFNQIQRQVTQMVFLSMLMSSPLWNQRPHVKEKLPILSLFLVTHLSTRALMAR